MNTSGTPIALPLRLWLAVEVLFGIGAVLAVGVAPADTAANFAWTINPVVMAATLGAFYITSAPLFLLPFLARRWEMIRAMILPTALFSTIQLAATFLHWDKFAIGTVPFYVWFASYLLPPPIFVAAYLWHQRKTSQDSPTTGQLSFGLRQTLLIVGSALTILSLLTLFIPAWLIPIFPWQLTPLTARSLSGWLAAVGTLMLSIRRENNRTRTLLATPMLILILPALVLQLTRFAGEVDWSNAALWVGLALFAVVGICGLMLTKGNWREALS
jgi:hypothetical protein